MTPSELVIVSALLLLSSLLVNAGRERLALRRRVASLERLTGEMREVVEAQEVKFKGQAAVVDALRDLFDDCDSTYEEAIGKIKANVASMCQDVNTVRRTLVAEGMMRPGEGQA